MSAAVFVRILHKKKYPPPPRSGRSGRPSSPRVLPCLSSFMKYFCACVRTCPQESVDVWVPKSGGSAGECIRIRLGSWNRDTATARVCFYRLHHIHPTFTIDNSYPFFINLTCGSWKHDYFDNFVMFLYLSFWIFFPFFKLASPSLLFFLFFSHLQLPQVKIRETITEKKTYLPGFVVTRGAQQLG